MPQIEKITYITTIYWILISYFAVYLDLIVTYLYKFLTSLKFDLKRLSLIITKTLRWNLDQHVLRQWSKQPIIVNIGLIILAINPEAGKRTARPPAHKYLYEYIFDADLWFWYWFEKFTIPQWEWTIPVMYILYPILGILYNKNAFKHFRGTWLTWKQRFAFVTVDIFLNCLFGPVALINETSILNQFVEMCPVSISPVFLLIELAVFTSFRSLMTQILNLEGPNLEITCKLHSKLLTVWISRMFIICAFIALISLNFYWISSYGLDKKAMGAVISIALSFLSALVFLVIFLKFMFYIKSGQWETYLANWKKDIEELDEAVADKHSVVRNVPLHKEKDLIRELGKKFSKWENIYSPIYKHFAWKTLREKRQTELDKINKEKLKPANFSVPIESIYENYSDVKIFGLVIINKTRFKRLETFIDKIFKKIFKC
jgi:hypothetical protein